MSYSETYLGDGLYASFDGYQIRLWTVRNHGVHEVFLEPGVLARFEEYVAMLRDGSHEKSRRS